MAHAKIVVNVTDKHGNPMIGLEVELVDTGAFTAANHDPIEHVVAIESTDISGTATFTGLNPSMYYARPRITRPDIRIQTLMASGIGILCYSAVVDPNGRGTHTTIQAAIDALGLTGGTVLICAGTYQENLVVAGDTENLWLIGISRNCVTIQGTAASPTITIDAAGTGPVNSLRLEHLTIDHTGAQTLLYFNSVAGGTPIHIDLLDLRFLSGSMGIDMSDLNGGREFTLRDIIMESTVMDAGQLEVSDLHVTNCKLYCAGKGLYISGATATTGTRISGCRFGGGSSHALRIGTANDVQISNCRFIAVGTATKGILVGSVAGLVIDGCIIRLADGVGIDLSAVASAVIISDCTLACASGQDTARVGITVSGFCSDISISDCRIKGFKFYGIQLETQISTGAQHFIIGDCIIENGEDTHSIRISSWDYGTIEGCVLIGTGGAGTTYGVYGENSPTNVVIVGNVVEDHDGMTNLVNGVNGNIIGSNTGSGGGMGPSPHDPVTLDANADTLLSLSTQELGLDTQAANLVFAGPDAGGAAVPTFRSLVDADIPAAIARDAEVTAAIAAHTGDDDAHHAPVTLAGGSAAELTLDGQELTLAAVLTPTEHTAIGDGAPHHAKYTDAEAVTAVEAADPLDLANALQVDTINEHTLDAGVTVEGVKNLDSFIELSVIEEPGNSGGIRLFCTELALQPTLYVKRGALAADRMALFEEIVPTVEGESTLDLLGDVTISAIRSLAVATLVEKVADAGISIEGVKALDSFLEFTEIAKPANPAANKLRFYAKDKAGVSALYFLQDDGTEVEVGAGGGGGDGDSIWDADSDTGVQTEEAADEDKVRMDVAGTERFVLQNTAPHFTVTGQIKVSDTIGLKGTTPSDDNWLYAAPVLPAVTTSQCMIRLDPLITLTATNKSVTGLSGNPVVYVENGLNAARVAGLYFTGGVYVGNNKVATVGEIMGCGVGMSAFVMGAAGSEIIDKLWTFRGYVPALTALTGANLSVGEFNGLELDPVNSIYIGDGYQLHLGNIENATGVNIIIEAGPSTPYFRLEGGLAPAGVNSNAIVNFGGVLYRLTRNAGTGAVETVAI